MKFDVIFGALNKRTFEKIVYANGQSCIEAPKKGVSNVEILVMPQTGGQAKTYPSIHPGKVLYPVNVGDYISVQEVRHGTRWAGLYRVIDITDKEIIGEPC